MQTYIIKNQTKPNERGEMKQIQTAKPGLFMKKNGDCINIVWVDEGVSVGVGDNDQGYFFNENEWEMLNELLKPTRYSQETNEEKALNQICELIASVRTNGAYPAESFVGGIIKDLIAQVQQEAYEAGQKSREKEIVEKIKNSKTPEKLIKEQYECYDFDEAEVYALENEIIENIIKSLSLTKESK